MSTQNPKSMDEQIALFRFGIIAPVIHQTVSSQTQYLKEIAKSSFDVPGYGRKKYSWKTFKHWLRLFRILGFDGLKPQTRKDAKSTRKIDHSLIDIIPQKLIDYPSLSVSDLFRLLVKEGYISPGRICEATLRKFISDNQLMSKNSSPTPRRAFEKPHVNDLWIADFLHGPHLIIDGKKSKTFLVAIIDDHSRMIVGSSWILAENTLALELAFKQALLTYGLPKLFYCDNGQVFSSSHLQLVCARLGIALVHSKPYDSPSRGKIERFFRTVRQNFLPFCPLNDHYSIDKLNQLFFQWLDLYHHQYHHGIDQSPLDKFLADAQNIPLRKTTQNEIDQVFYQTFTRLVKNDATISAYGILFEVPAKYIGRLVQLRHPTGEPDQLYIYENDQPLAKLNKLDKIANSSSPLKGIKFYTEGTND